eukprot:GGOE01056719.1.p1 GENE.GGOE01056719.1~~GGOE01056719.1.p1  ORF type:complete len:740 (+),score=216.30 GGOE01056719.1:35-2221(+)
MPAVVKSGQRGLAGLYRFTQQDWEEQYQVRMLQWCFWPAVVHFCSTIFVDTIHLVGYFGTGGESDAPLFIWLLVAVDIAAFFLIVLLQFFKPLLRYVKPILSIFLCIEAVRNAALLTLQAQYWTEHSYNHIVPAGSSIRVGGSDGWVDVGTRLRDHLAMLAGLRALQATFSVCFRSWVFSVMIGLNRWSIGTCLWICGAFVVGVGVTPDMSMQTLISAVIMALHATTFCLLCAAVFERMLRRNFEAERLLWWELQASQMADSVLNHSLKNTLADVAGNVEMFLAGALPTRVLEECIVTLRRGVRSCKERQGYLKLVAGQYEPVLNAINLQNFGRQLLAGRNATGRFLDCTIYADEMLLTLIFDNALSNAAKHGHPSCPEVTFTVEEIPADACRDLAEGRRRFSFQVTNIANPNSAELTPQFVQQLFAGCTAPQQQRISIVVPALSDRIGLAHCSMAAKLGGISLSLFQEDDLVTFTGMLDAEVSAVHRTTLDAEAPPAAPSFPAGLQFVVLDDSLCAQRLLRFHIQQWCAPASVICLGASAADIPPFLSHALLADIVILDEHLDWEVDRHLGSDLVRQLRRLRYEGFICVRSADDSPADQAHFLRAGANCSVGKDLLGRAPPGPPYGESPFASHIWCQGPLLPGPVMVQRLQAEYSAFVRPPLVAVNPAEPNEPRPPTPSPLPRSGMSVADLCPLPISDPTMGSESCAGSDNSATALSALILDEALFR